MHILDSDIRKTSPKIVEVDAERIVTVDLPMRRGAMFTTYTMRPSEMTMDFIRSVQAMFKDKQKKKQKELQESAGGFCNSFAF